MVVALVRIAPQVIKAVPPDPSSLGNTSCGSWSCVDPFPFPTRSRLLLHNIVKSRLQVCKVGSTLFVGVGSEDLPSHEPPRCTSASEELELGKTLLWKNVEAVHGYPASMSFPVALAENRGMQCLVDEFDNHATCCTLQPLRWQSEVCTRVPTWNAGNNHGRLPPVLWPRILPRSQDMKAGLDVGFGTEEWKVISRQKSRKMGHKLLSVGVAGIQSAIA